MACTQAITIYSFACITSAAALQKCVCFATSRALLRPSLEALSVLISIARSSASMQVKDLLPEHLQSEADKVVKGTDTMDVWFDSGSSWSGVADLRDGLSYPADLYLEGSDQHRCALAPLLEVEQCQLLCFCISSIDPGVCRILHRIADPNVTPLLCDKPGRRC